MYIHYIIVDLVLEYIIFINYLGIQAINIIIYTCRAHYYNLREWACELILKSYIIYIRFIRVLCLDTPGNLFIVK